MLGLKEYQTQTFDKCKNCYEKYYNLKEALFERIQKCKKKKKVSYMETKSFYMGKIKINTYTHKVKTNDSLGENNRQMAGYLI